MNRLGPSFGDAYPGVQFPVDHYEQYMASTVPDWDLPEMRSQYLCDGAIALLETVGPSVVFSHSASVSVGWMLVRQRPELVRAHVAVEGGGGPIDELSPSGGVANGSLDARVESELCEYAKVPSLTVLGDNFSQDPLWSLFRQSSERFANLVSERGGRADVLDLPELGETGNTHVPMLDRNSHRVFDLIATWLEVNCQM
jgi:pimeloyl-ACP methyl ester carboxylesterase